MYAMLCATFADSESPPGRLPHPGPSWQAAHGNSRPNMGTPSLPYQATGSRARNNRLGAQSSWNNLRLNIGVNTYPHAIQFLEAPAPWERHIYRNRSQG